MKKDATLTIAVIYDDEKTNVEAVAEALEQALDAAAVTPGVLDACGGVEIGEVLVAADGLGIV